MLVEEQSVVLREGKLIEQVSGDLGCGRVVTVIVVVQDSVDVLGRLAATEMARIVGRMVTAARVAAAPGRPERAVFLHLRALGAASCTAPGDAVASCRVAFVAASCKK